MFPVPCVCLLDIPYKPEKPFCSMMRRVVPIAIFMSSLLKAFLLVYIKFSMLWRGVSAVCKEKLELDI